MATLKGCNEEVDLTRGTPQGGVLSPVIWNLAFEEFIELFKRGPVEANVFADDAALVVVGPDRNVLVDLM